MGHKVRPSPGPPGRHTPGAAAESDDAAALRQVVKATVKEMEYLFQVLGPV